MKLRCARYAFVKNVIKIIIFYTFSEYAFTQEPEIIKADEKSLYPALVGGLFTNTVFHLTSRLLGADFAQTSMESIKTNLTSAWVWDSDGFLFNHPGHPYQGGLYHAAARANGFSFYESIFFDGLGSLTWELFGETDIPSLNDLIVTSFGGAAFGEMLHRLYLETSSPLTSALVSPMDALNNAVLRKSPPRTHNLYYFSTMTGPGWIQSIKEDREQLKRLRDSGIRPTSSRIFTGNIGFEVIYGDPFVHNSKMPYSQFEIAALMGVSFYPLWLDWTFLSDGYLVSFNPVDTEKDKFSTGLSMQYDLIVGNNTNFASNALDWSFKWKHIFNSIHIELKSHIGWTFFGSSEFYPFAETIDSNIKLHETENDYGTGGNIKIFFKIKTQRYGEVTLGICNYLLLIIPLNKPESRGVEYLNLSSLGYSYPLTKNISLIVDNSFYIKTGRSQRETNVVSIANRLFLGIKYTFIER